MKYGAGSAVAGIFFSLALGAMGCRDYRLESIPSDPDSGFTTEIEPSPPDGGPSDDPLDAGPLPTCVPNAQYVYLISVDGDLLRFDPDTLESEQVATLRCPTWSSPFSMAVDRTGRAWIVYTDSRIYWVDVRNGHCTQSPYERTLSGFDTFGMAFAYDTSDATSESLFIASRTGQLGYINTETLASGLVGNPHAWGDQELTGARNGLYALFGIRSLPFTVAQLDPMTGNEWSETTLDNVVAPNAGFNFAVSAWKTHIWIFEGNANTSNVFEYDPDTRKAAQRATLPFGIVGAGVSTCAQ